MFRLEFTETLILITIILWLVVGAVVAYSSAIHIMKLSYKLEPSQRVDRKEAFQTCLLASPFGIFGIVFWLRAVSSVETTRLREIEELKIYVWSRVNMWVKVSRTFKVTDITICDFTGDVILICSDATPKVLASMDPYHLHDIREQLKNHPCPRFRLLKQVFFRFNYIENDQPVFPEYSLLKVDSQLKG